MTKTTSAGAYDVIANVTAAFAARPDVTIDDIVQLVARLSAELGGDSHFVPDAGKRLPAAGVPAVQDGRPAPALPIERAVAEDKVYCLCCGKGFKMLKRHLGAEHGLSEDEYRALFNLPADMPLVAPSYSERKAAYARKVGLGKYSREGAAA
jgi:predicted transcriptional regulator